VLLPFSLFIFKNASIIIFLFNAPLDLRCKASFDVQRVQVEADYRQARRENGCASQALSSAAIFFFSKPCVFANNF
jgi:hypothetical protein